jgi:stage II sporulation protein P
MTQKNEEYIINSLRNSPDLIPSNEFVSKTRNELQLRARNMSKKKPIYSKYIISTGLAVSMILIAWITLFSGSNQINTAAIINAGQIITNPQNIITDVKNEPLVFIYHTHNRESFVPELKISSPDEAQSSDINKNITSVGRYLSEKLEELGVKTLVDQSDYESKPNFDFKDSYKLSRTTVVNALQSNPTLKMVFDVHRDSLPRDKTTVKINGNDVATVRFVVANSNEKYEENMKFASTLHDQLESLYPGLSPQIFLVKQPEGESSQSYNQDLFINSLFIEIGGPENSLIEEYRAVDILAQIIAELAKNN